VNLPLIAVLAVGILLAGGAPSAQQLTAPAPGGNAASLPAGSPALNAQLEQMDAQMGRLRALHDRMIRAATPDERQRLMAEQHRAIEEGMGMMTRMMSAIGGNAPLERKGGPPDQDSTTQIMQKGIEMMALMTQMMREQLGLIARPKGPAAKIAK
jgi:hypothetical protein